MFTKEMTSSEYMSRLRYGHSGTLADPLPKLGKCRWCGEPTRDKIGSVYECLDCSFDYDDY